jgi:hypothetical protein
MSVGLTLSSSEMLVTLTTGVTIADEMLCWSVELMTRDTVNVTTPGIRGEGGGEEDDNGDTDGGGGDGDGGDGGGGDGDGDGGGGDGDAAGGGDEPIDDSSVGVAISCDGV